MAAAPTAMGRQRLTGIPKLYFSRPSPILRIGTDSHSMGVDRAGRDPFDLLNGILRSLALERDPRGLTATAVAERRARHIAQSATAKPGQGAARVDLRLLFPTMLSRSNDAG